MLPLNLNGLSVYDLAIGRVYSDTICTLKMTANTEQHFNIPALATKVIIATGASAAKVHFNYWIRMDGVGSVASIPTGNILDGTASDLNPTSYVIRPTDMRISVITNDSLYITFSFYL